VCCKIIKGEKGFVDEYFSNLLKFIGEDVKREGLLRTPQRAAKAFQYLTRGYGEDVEGGEEDDKGIN